MPITANPFPGMRTIGTTRIGTAASKAGITHQIYGGVGSGGGGGGGTSGVASAGGGGGGGSAGSAGTNTEYADLYKQILSRLEGGGASLEADLASIEAGKREAIARGEQNIVSSGLAGTTVMAGVPIAAEKSAALSRLKARGVTENKYLQALTNFANLAFQAREGSLSREQSRLNLQASLASSERRASMGGSSVYIPESERYAGGTGPGVAYGSTPTVSTEPFNKPIGSGYYGDYKTEQFPSIYGTADAPVPNWMA